VLWCVSCLVKERVEERGSLRDAEVDAVAEGLGDLDMGEPGCFAHLGKLVTVDVGLPAFIAWKTAAWDAI
jgi:hypothetical protein